MKTNSGTIGCEICAQPGERLDECDPEQVRDLVRARGWVFFSGFDPSVEDYETFTARFGACAGTREVHYPEGGEALGFHAEDAYNPYRPDTIWFLCAFQGSDGGIPTGVVDGVELLASLPAQWQDFCRENSLRFDRQWLASTWQQALGRDARDELEEALQAIPGLGYEFLSDDGLHVSYETPIVVTTQAGDESFCNTLLQAATDHEFYGMALASGSPVPDELLATVEALAIDQETPLGWTTGDVAVIDNYRMMHRRSEYSRSDRDLRARHCEDFFGSAIPAADTPVAAWAKRLIQGDEDWPARVGPPVGAAL